MFGIKPFRTEMNFLKIYPFLTHAFSKSTTPHILFYPKFGKMFPDSDPLNFGIKRVCTPKRSGVSVYASVLLKKMYRVLRVLRFFYQVSGPHTVQKTTELRYVLRNNFPKLERLLSCRLDTRGLVVFKLNAVKIKKILTCYKNLLLFSDLNVT
jgi:hypothetical protein